MRKIHVVLPLLALASCGPEAKDYDAQAMCQSIGNQPGTRAYDECVEAERSRKMLEQQRREYEQMKQEKEDWRRRGY